MPRYFTLKPRADDDWYEPAINHIPTVDEAEPVDTGLIDEHGNSIFRAPRPVGFGKDEEW